MIAHDREQTAQRVRVGMVGLAAVLLLIGLAAAIFSTARNDRPLVVVGSARADVVANLISENASLPGDGAVSEPLAELGAAPSTATTNTVQPTPRSR